MIDYEVSDISVPPVDGVRKKMRTSLQDWQSNISCILEWSPYCTELQVLTQFNDLGWNGTKVVVYNLWFSDDGILELDFDSDFTDIQLRGGPKSDKAKPVQAQLAQEHIANGYHHSLRGNQWSIANDLKFAEQIVYQPQLGRHNEPFWKVWQDNSSRGRGVIGVLEANFIEPAHDKQDFERTAVLLRLENRLKRMTLDYWNLHCHLVGYKPNTKAGKAQKRATPSPSIDYPVPIASLIPHLPHSTGDLLSSGPVSTRSSIQDSEWNPEAGPQVKPEPTEYPQDSSKRPRSQQKRQRMDRSDSSEELDSGKGNQSYMELLDENSRYLSTRIDKIELHFKKLQKEHENLRQENKELQQHKAESESEVSKMEKKFIEERESKMKLMNKSCTH